MWLATPAQSLTTSSPSPAPSAPSVRHLFNAPASQRFPFINDFDGSIVSGHEGVCKPDPAIYALLFERYSITPERAVFIDDKLENVEAARRLGMHGIHFTDPQALPSALRALGLPV